MIKKEEIKVINFLQDFGCATLRQLQILFCKPNDNFKDILSGNLVSKNGEVFVHNTKTIDDKMLVALDILCKYRNKLSKYYLGYYPVYISFLTKENLLYNIIVADDENAKGIVKIVNSYNITLPKADKLILAFKDEGELENIDCEIPFLYCTYPGLEVINEES